jgi:hypothetical protein
MRALPLPICVAYLSRLVSDYQIDSMLFQSYPDTGWTPMLLGRKGTKTHLKTRDRQYPLRHAFPPTIPSLVVPAHRCEGMWHTLHWSCALAVAAVICLFYLFANVFELNACYL